jgi:T4 beta protein
MLSSAYSYRPILKVRQAAISGHAFLTWKAQLKSTPVFEIVPFSTLFYEPEPGPKFPPQPIIGHITKQVTLIAQAMHGQGEAFIDLHLLNGSVLWRYPILPRLIFDQLYSKGIQAIPVIRANTPPVILACLKKIHLDWDCGFMIRLGRLDMTSSRQLQTIMKWIRVPLQEIDLLLDYGSVLDAATETLVQSAVGFINDSLPFLFEWRSLTLASGAFPSDPRIYSPSTHHGLPRLDWRFWSLLRQQGLLRVPSFADYGPAHPRFSVRRASHNHGANRWYTSDAHWYLLHRHAKTKQNIQDSCRQFIESPIYEKADSSYGNNQILLCGTGEITINSAAEWSRICYNRHFEKVCNMLPAH